MNGGEDLTVQSAGATAQPDGSRAPIDELPGDAKFDAFISYSHVNREFALELRDALTKHDKNAWLDEAGIAPAERWESALRRAIEGADAFVFVISPASAVSKECRRELDHALELNKRILPVVAEGVDPEDLPEELAARQFIPARGRFDDDFDHSVQTLVSAMGTDLEWLQEHTEWNLKAVEWADHGRDSSFLLAGHELELAEEWRARSAGRQPGLSKLQNNLIFESRRAATRRLRRSRAFVSVALAVALGLAVFAFIQREQAVNEQHVASSGELAAESVLQLNVDPQLSLLLADRAAHTKQTAAALDALRRAIPANHLIRTLQADDKPVDAAAWAPDDKSVLTVSDDGYARLWDAATGRVLRRLDTGSVRFQGGSFDPRGQRVLTWGPGGVRIWDAATGARLATFTDPGFFQLEDAIFSPDGAMVATASGPGADGTYALWDSRTGARLHRLETSGSLGQANLGGDIAFSPNSRLVAAGSENGLAAIFDAASGRLVKVLNVSAGAGGEQQLVSTVAFSPDGSRLLTATGPAPFGGPLADAGPQQSQVWSLVSGRKLLAVNGGAPVWSSSGGRVLTTSSDGTARVWSAASGALVAQMKATFPISGTGAFAPHSDDVLTGSATGYGAVWSEPSGTQLATLAGDTGAVYSAGFSSDGTRILTYSSDGSARIWDTGAVTPVAQPLAPQLKSAVSAIADQPLSPQFGYSGDPLTRLMAVAVGTNGAGQRVEIFDTGSGRVTAVVPTGGRQQYFGAAFDRAGRVVLLTTGSVANAPLPAELRRAHGGQLLHVLPAHALEGTVSPDGKLALTTDSRNVLTVWDVASGRRLRVFTAHSHHSIGGGALLTVSVKFSPDSKLVLSSDNAGYSYVWNARDGRILNSIRGPGEPPGMWSGWGGAISPDDRLVVTVASWNSAAHVYQVGKRPPLVTLRGSEQDIVDAAFSPDSSLLATISSDGVRLWTTRETNPVLTLAGSFGTAVAFAPDGLSLVIGSPSGVGPGESLPCDVCGGFSRLLALAHGKETRTFTPEERVLYLGGS